MIYEFDGFIPVIHETAFVHPNAAVTGNVIIGRDVYVGPGAAFVAIGVALCSKMAVMCKKTAPFICFLA